MSNLNVVVLVSIARHDKSGRPMLAPNDIQALEQARSICTVPRVVHVGQPGDEMVLRQYLGLGFPRLEAIEAEPGQDICAQLSAYLKQICRHICRLQTAYALNAKAERCKPLAQGHCVILQGCAKQLPHLFQEGSICPRQKCMGPGHRPLTLPHPCSECLLAEHVLSPARLLPEQDKIIWEQKVLHHLQPIPCQRGPRGQMSDAILGTLKIC